MKRSATRPASAFRKPLSAALKHALDYLDSLHRTPVGPSADIATLRARFEKPLKDEGIPSEQVISELVDDAKGGIIGWTGSRFYAWVIGGSVPHRLAADWLTPPGIRMPASMPRSRGRGGRRGRRRVAQGNSRPSSQPDLPW